jgi:cytochrome b6-f complex iron-sulfur subunit
MRVSPHRVRDAVEALLADGRPDWRSEAIDTEVLRVAIALSAARPGAGLARSEYVIELRRRLLREYGPTSAPPTVHRRRFLAVAGVVAGSAAGAAAGVTVIDHGQRLQPGSTAGEANVVTRGTWQTVATSAGLAAQGVVRFASASVVGFAVMDGGELRALSGVCTHQGCLLEYREQGRELACPCHRVTFALDGNVRADQIRGLKALPRLPVREREGRIEVFLTSESGGVTPGGGVTPAGGTGAQSS